MNHMCTCYKTKEKEEVIVGDAFQTGMGVAFFIEEATL